jgi:predicted regulator of Ras-like GTPase activity (Roadblock/LC7/MglB family)
MKFLQQLGAALPQISTRKSASTPNRTDEGPLYSYGARGGGARLRPAQTAEQREATNVNAAELAITGRDPDALASLIAAIRPRITPEPESLRATAPADPTDISATADISGFVGSCLVDSDSGLMLASEGGEAIDLEAAAALNTQVVRAEHEVIEVLGLDDHIEDILITMTRQLHFIRPLEASPQVFLYVCLDKKNANLGMARMQVNKIESGLKL